MAISNQKYPSVEPHPFPLPLIRQRLRGKDNMIGGGEVGRVAKKGT